MFSCIGMPLFHRYPVFDRPGTHVAFCGAYMCTFLEESDAASLQTCHRRCAREIAARMAWTHGVGSWMSLLNPVHLVDLARGSGSLPRRLLWPSQQWPRGLCALIALR